MKRISINGTAKGRRALAAFPATAAGMLTGITVMDPKARLAADSAAVGDEIATDMAKTYRLKLAKPEAYSGEAWFAPLIRWGMRVMDDDDALIDKFGISMATLKRWAAGATTPGPLARQSVIVRMDEAVSEKFNLTPMEFPEDEPAHIEAQG